MTILYTDEQTYEIYNNKKQVREAKYVLFKISKIHSKAFHASTTKGSVELAFSGIFKNFYPLAKNIIDNNQSNSKNIDKVVTDKDIIGTFNDIDFPEFKLYIDDEMKDPKHQLQNYISSFKKVAKDEKLREQLIKHCNNNSDEIEDAGMVCSENFINYTAKILDE